MAFSELPARKTLTDHLVMQLSCIDNGIAVDLGIQRPDGDVWTCYTKGICVPSAGSTGRRSGVPVIGERHSAACPHFRLTVCPLTEVSVHDDKPGCASEITGIGDDEVNPRSQPTKWQFMLTCGEDPFEQQLL